MIRITVEMTGLPGAPFYNVLHFSGSDLANATAAAAAAGQFWGNVRGMMVNDIVVSFDGNAFVVDEASGQTINSFAVPTWSFVGDEETERVPDAVQGLITHRSASWVSGRRLTGKIYVPGMTEAAWVDGTIAVNFQNDLQTAYTILRDAGGTTELLVYSRTHNTSAPSTSATIPPQGAILRSRRS